MRLRKAWARSLREPFGTKLRLAFASPQDAGDLSGPGIEGSEQLPTQTGTRSHALVPTRSTSSRDNVFPHLNKLSPWVGALAYPHSLRLLPVDLAGFASKHRVLFQYAALGWASA